MRQCPRLRHGSVPPLRFVPLVPLLYCAVAACVSPTGPEPVASLPLPSAAAQANAALPLPARPGNSARTSLFGRSSGNAANTAEGGNSAADAPPQTQAQTQGQSAAWLDRPVPGEFQRVDANLWRTSMPAAAVFQAIAKALSQNYVLSGTDRRALTVQTDWDKFFIDGRLFRNRISVTVFPVGTRQTDVAIRNTVEYASGKQPGGETALADWLPSPDVTDEVPRLIQSLQRLAGVPAVSRPNLR